MGSFDNMQTAHTFWPFPPRPEQQRVFDAVVKGWNQYDVFVIIMPTGAGKSNISAALSKWCWHVQGLPCTTIVPNNLLRKQLVDDYGFATLPAKGSPEFEQQRELYLNSPLRAINHMTLLSNKAYSPVQIWDEGHKVGGLIQDMESGVIWPHLTHIPDNIWSPIQLTAWAQEHAHQDKAVEKLAARISKNPDEWVMDWGLEEYRGRPRRRLRIMPLTARSNKPVFWPPYWVKKHIFMSATISEEELYDIGLDNKRTLFIEADSPIPEERRPIIYEPAGNMSMTTQDRDMSRLVRKLVELADRHAGTKGLVHTTYAMAEKIKLALQRIGGDSRFLFHDNWSKQQTLTKWMLSHPTEGRILVGCGMAEGLDLKGDKCHWQAITKIMYPNKADIAVWAKSQHRPHYYIWAAAKELMQATGRVCRTPDDYGITYILTEEWPVFYNRHRHTLFNFWRKAYAKSVEISFDESSI